MAEKDLRTLLEGLHEELQRAESVDEKGRDLLRDLDADIRALLERSGESGSNAVIASLQSTINYFEVTHPSLTRALSDIMSALSNAGI